MLRDLARASAVVGTLGSLLSCSDPVPPSPRGALENAIQNVSGCPAGHTAFSIGDQIDAIQSNGGTERATNGQDGAIVKCEVRKADSGFVISGKLKAETIQTDSSGQPFTESFEISANFPHFTPGSGTAQIYTSDSFTQRSYGDPACTLTVKSLGNDDAGGALWATYSCNNFSDPNSPGLLCKLVGTIVLENCDK